MRNASAAYRARLAENSKVLLKATLTLADLTTQVQLTGEDFALGGASTSESTSRSGRFDVGAAIVGTCTVTLANYDGEFDDYDFTGSTLVLYAGVRLSGTEVEWLKLGTYDVEQPDSYDATITLRCFDALGRLAIPYADVPTTYPATLQTIVLDLLTYAGVPMSVATFPNSSYTVATRPTDTSLTCLDVLGFAAQAAACFAACDANGGVYLTWYDMTGTPREVTAIRSLTVGTDDVVITGVSVTAANAYAADGTETIGETALSGVEGYVLTVANNPLIEAGKAATVAANIAQSVVGMQFRPLSATIYGDPTLTAGDYVRVVDRRGRQYDAIATRVSWSASGSQSVACEAESPGRNSAAKRSSAIARALTEIRKVADIAIRTGGQALSAARQAAGIAAATDQHFWTDTNGVHVTEITQEEWTSEDEGEGPSGPNLLANSLGILLRNALTNLVSVASGAITFYDGAGNLATNVMAAFGVNGTDLYENGRLAAHFGSDETALYDGSVKTVSITDALVNIGYMTSGGAQRVLQLTENALRFINYANTLFEVSVTPGETQGDPASTYIKVGQRLTSSETPGADSASFGKSMAKGIATLAAGWYTQAQSDYQTVVGRYNRLDSSGAHLLIVGNGTSSTARSNAFTVAADGRIFPGNRSTKTYTASGASGSNVSDVITASSGFTISSVSVQRWGPYVHISGDCSPTSAIDLGNYGVAPGSDSGMLVGTLVSGLRPGVERHCPYHRGSYYNLFYVQTSGQLRFKGMIDPGNPTGSVNLTTSSVLHFDLEFLVSGSFSNSSF